MTSQPIFNINVPELDPAKISAAAQKYWEIALGVVPTTQPEAEAEEPVTVQSEDQEDEPTDYEEAVRVLKLAEDAALKARPEAANALVSIADRYIRLGGF